MIIFVEAGRRVESPEVRMSIPEDRIMGPGEDAILLAPSACYQHEGFCWKRASPFVSVVAPWISLSPWLNVLENCSARTNSWRAYGRM